MQRAVAYARYSTDNQDDNSIAYQMEAIQGYCKKHSLSLIGMYKDEASTGYNDKRDDLQRMILAAESGEFDCIVIYDIGRLSRNVKDWFSFRDRLRRLDVKLYSCEDRLSEPDDPSSFLSEGMKIMMSQHFVMETRRKTIAGQGIKAKKGIFLGGTPPLGYDVEDGGTRQVVQKYVSQIILSDTTVEITGMSDKYVSNSTCGGTQHLLFTLWFSDENGCRVISQTAITIQNPIVPICKGNID